MKPNFLFFLATLLFLFSCTPDTPEESVKETNPLAGSYVIKSVILKNCNTSSNNLVANFSTNNDCVSNIEFEHCRVGKLIISEDNTFTSTLRVTRKSLLLNLTVGLYSINGQGKATAASNIMNICIGNNCDDFVIDGNTFTHTYESLDCTNVIVLEKE